MRVFVSAGEPSGDLHGANLIHSLRKRRPDLRIDGFGGERMTAAGCQLLYPLAEHAVVGVRRAIASVPHFWGVLNRADKHFTEQRPDVLVMIDNPGFHWWLARTARKHGIPVVYFVPPQLWAWGGWRVGKMRRLVDRVLCNLPFEQAWYQQRGIAARWVGHPYFDELLSQRLDQRFVDEQRAKPGTIVGLLPGSRRQELEKNVPSLIRAAEIIRERRPEVRFLVAALKDSHRLRILDQLGDRELPLEVHAGRTPEIIELAHSTIAVSGSVGLELLFRGKPSVVTYRGKWTGVQAARLLMQCKYISLVNLLADKELFPEFLSHKCEAPALARHVLRWLEDPVGYDVLRTQLLELRDRVAEPGACDRAAGEILSLVDEKKRVAA